MAGDLERYPTTGFAGSRIGTTVPDLAWNQAARRPVHIHVRRSNLRDSNLERELSKAYDAASTERSDICPLTAAV